MTTHRSVRLSAWIAQSRSENTDYPGEVIDVVWRRGSNHEQREDTMRMLRDCGTLVALTAGVLGGCAADEAPPAGYGASAPVATTPISSAAAAPDLDALRALGVVEVGDLLVALPAEATACYGLPCGEWQAAANAEVARQMPRLDQLTAGAQAAMKTRDQYAAPSSEEIAADLQKLRDLYIVQIGDLLVDVPQPSANCYNLVCPDDQARADAANAERATALSAIANSVTDI